MVVRLELAKDTAIVVENRTSFAAKLDVFAIEFPLVVFNADKNHFSEHEVAVAAETALNYICQTLIALKNQRAKDKAVDALKNDVKNGHRFPANTPGNAETSQPSTVENREILENEDKND